MWGIFTRVSNNRVHIVPLDTVHYFTEVYIYIMYRLSSDVCQFKCNHASHGHACMQLVCTDACCVSLLDIQYIASMNNGKYIVHTMLCALYSI